jgi:adenosine deaminase CECR1
MEGSHHHFPELYKANVPIAISCDDPSLFGYEGVSPDYYYIFMTNKYLHMSDLEKLVRTSITAASMTDEEKSKALDFLDVQWEDFLEKALKKFSN